MTNSDRIPPHLRDHIARAYAHGRLDSTHHGDTWVHVTEFVRAVLRDRPATLHALHLLYDAMLTAGDHVYGTPNTPQTPAPTTQPIPIGQRLYMDHSRCTHPGTNNARHTCRHTARMAGTWPHPAPTATAQ